MNITKTLNLLRNSEFSFAYNKDNRFFYINNNPVSQKLKEEDRHEFEDECLENIMKSIANLLPESYRGVYK